MINIDPILLTSKKRKLEELKEYLKSEFVGIDQVIDELVDKIKIWYLMPELLEKPIIINLWGMTGVGKTDLVRKIVKFLDFTDRYSEIELSHSDSSSSHRYVNSISEVLNLYSIVPEEPSILFFDEIQKFRTINESQNEIKDLRFQDFWELLSDGKLSKKNQIEEISALYTRLTQRKASQDFRKNKNQKKDEAKDGTSNENEQEEPEFLYDWDIKRIKTYLIKNNSKAELDKLSTMTGEETLEKIKELFNSKKIFETDDYTKSLIIISGNLDEAYGMAKETQEAEIDPDIFHEKTKNINIIRIKKALQERFKPEQISRFGNIHFIYPSFRSDDFKKLIQINLNKLTKKASSEYNISLHFDESINNLIYKNGVFPVQGVRPVFSAINDIVESHLAEFFYICLTENLNYIKMFYDYHEKKIKAEMFSEQDIFSQKQMEIPFVGRVDAVRQKSSENEAIVTSVHEAGHALVYALCFNLAPLQLKINLASFGAAGFTFPHKIDLNYKLSLYKVRTLLAGVLAEQIIFGHDYVNNGGGSDIEQATMLLSDMIRVFGQYDQLVTIVNTNNKSASMLNTNFDVTNQKIEKIIENETHITKQLLSNHKHILKELSSELAKTHEINPERFKTIMLKHNINVEIKPESYKASVDYIELFEK